MKEFTNSQLKKLNFKMDKVKIFDSFAGIGALTNAHKFLGVPYEIIGMSEIDVDAIISYATIHIDNFKDIEFNYPDENTMRKFLMDRNIGWDFKKQKSSIPRLKKDKLYKVYKASILLNNLGDISTIDYSKISDFDLFNLSFCCQDISNAGIQKGLTNEDGTPTGSGLVKYGIELIKCKKPKYIMIENVKALIQKKFINDFYSIVNEIESYGYKCYYPKKENGEPTCLNAKNYGIPQNRERIYVICIRNDINCNFNFPNGFDNGIRLKDILEDEVEDKYYLSEEIQNRFVLNGNKDINRNELNCLGTTDSNKKIGQRDRIYGENGISPNLTATDYKQPKQILDNKYLDCKRIGGIFDTEKSQHQIGSVWDKNKLSPTLDTMQGGYRQPCVLDNEVNFRIRKLTPKECWRLMGFSDKQFEKAKEMGESDTQLYKQAGNSIVINVLYYIFKELYKDFIIK